MAALRLFKENGYRSTSVEQIAAAANVSRSTFFRYFGSKEAVLFSPSDDAAGLLVELLASRPSHEGPLRAFEEALVEVIRRVGANFDRDTGSVFEETKRSDPELQAKSYIQTDRWTRVISDCFARRRKIGSSIQPSDRLAAAVCVAIAQQVGAEWRRSDIEAEAAVREAFSSLRGMTADADRRL